MCQSGQTVTDRKSSCGCPVLAGRLIEDMGEVIGHGFFTESQAVGDLAIALALGNQLEYPYFSLGEMSWKHRVCPTS